MGLAALFTDDGFAVQSGSPFRRGRAAIARGVTRPGGALQFAADSFSVSDTVKPRPAFVNGIDRSAYVASHREQQWRQHTIAARASAPPTECG